MKIITPLLLIVVLLLSGCAGTNNPDDPFESFNRGTNKFNDTLDKAILKPAAKAYDFAMPQFGRVMVNNFISNLDDFTVTLNDLLQLKFSHAASDGSRFLINSTFGLGGLFNVASRLEKRHEDFGQTLGYWGVGSGPYLVLPFLGPSSFRDSAGIYVDTVTDLPSKVEDIPTRNKYYVGSFIHKRANLLDAGKVLDAAALDKYQTLRDSYLMRRQSLVYDGDPPRVRYDDFEDDYDF